MSDVRGHANGRVALHDRVQLAVVRGLARLPARVQVLLSGRPPIVLDGQTLDPQLQLILAARRLRRTPGLLEPDPLRARARYHRELVAFTGPRTPVGSVRDLVIERGTDRAASPLHARHYAPRASTSGTRPLLVFLHGGGFALGDLDTADESCRILCAHGDLHVLSVDYRLAPEHPFPAALDDGLDALGWAWERGESLGADASRVAIGGESAGANVAAVVSRLAAHEVEARGVRAPVAQLLIYPPTDVRSSARCDELFGRGFFITSEDREGFARIWVDASGVPRGDPRVSPLRAPDLSGLPPALAYTAGFDILRDEGEAYAAALAAAGNDVRARRFPSLAHGFVNMTGVAPAARGATIEIARETGALLAGIVPSLAHGR